MNYLICALSLVAILSHIETQAAQPSLTAEQQNALLNEHIEQIRAVVEESQYRFGRNLEGAPEELVLSLRWELNKLPSTNENQSIQQLNTQLKKYVTYEDYPEI